MPSTRNGKVIAFDPALCGRAGKQASNIPGSNERAKRKRNTRSAAIKRAAKRVHNVVGDTQNNEQSSIVTTGTTEEARPTRCSDFGLDRVAKYPAIRFCSNCSWYDNAKALGRRVNPDSNTYGCRADLMSISHHPADNMPAPDDPMLEDLPPCPQEAAQESPTAPPQESPTAPQQESPTAPQQESPTTPQQESPTAPLYYYPDPPPSPTPQYCMPTSEPTGANTTRAEPDPNPAGTPLSHFVTQISAYQVEAERHKLEMQKVKAEKFVLAKRVTELNKMVGTKTETYQDRSLKDVLVETIESAVKSYEFKQKVTRLKTLTSDERATAIGEAGLSVFNGIAEPFYRRWSKKLWQGVYSPFNLARQMDLSGGLINYSMIEALRKMETGSEKYTRDTLFPSTHQMKKMMKRIEAKGDERVPFNMYTAAEKGCETIEFVYDKALTAICEAYQLVNIGNIPVAIAASIDGSNLAKKLWQVMAGIKIRDSRAIDPLTGKKVFNGIFSMAQSRNLCFPLIMRLCKETKQTFMDFGGFFEWAQQAQYKGMLINLSIEADFSAQWKGIGRGGAAKVCTYPCMHCGIKSDDLHHMNVKKCEQWCEKIHANKPGWKCYHCPIVTDELLEHMTIERDEIMSEIGDRLEAIADSRMTKEDPTANQGNENSQRDPCSIFFDPVTTAEKRTYMHLLNSELALREVSTRGSMTERRDRLKVMLVAEHRLAFVQEQLSVNERVDGAIFKILMDVIPCILHMENRVGLKILTMLLIDGLTNAGAGRLPQFDGSTQLRRRNQYMETVQKVMQETLLGSPDSPSHRTIPYDEYDGSLGIISMENYQVRKVITGLGHLIDVSISDTETKDLWKRGVTSYSEAMVILRKKTDFTDAQISEFQGKIDSWIQIWIELHQLNGMTNYVHLLAAGHVSEYLVMYRNLYKYSQQGWEAYNSLLKTVFFRRTRRGGGLNKSKLLPLGKWMQRRMLFLLGLKESDLDLEEDTVVGQDEDEEDEEDEEEDMLLSGWL